MSTYLFLDCEYNSYKGQLLSLALVGNGIPDFYVEQIITEKLDFWVENNVHLDKSTEEKLSAEEISRQLQEFLRPYSDIHIVCDWPDDVVYLCELIVTGPGTRIDTGLSDTSPITFKIIRKDFPSSMPHHALHDAIGIKSYYTS